MICVAVDGTIPSFYIQTGRCRPKRDPDGPPGFLVQCSPGAPGEPFVQEGTFSYTYFEPSGRGARLAYTRLVHPGRFLRLDERAFSLGVLRDFLADPSGKRGGFGRSIPPLRFRAVVFFAGYQETANVSAYVRAIEADEELAALRVRPIAEISNRDGQGAGHADLPLLLEHVALWAVVDALRRVPQVRQDLVHAARARNQYILTRWRQHAPFGWLHRWFWRPLREVRIALGALASYQSASAGFRQHAERQLRHVGTAMSDRLGLPLRATMERQRYIAEATATWGSAEATELIERRRVLLQGLAISVAAVGAFLAFLKLSCQ